MITSMENKYVGYILIGVSVLVLLNISIFNSTLGEMGGSTCTPADCPYHRTFNNVMYLSYGVVGLLVIVGIVLVISKPQERIIMKTRTVHKTIPKKKIDTSGFRPEDKKVFNLVKEKGTIFQADLIDTTGFGKAKMTRIIDRLEGKGIVERKRRGMTNVIVLIE